MDIGGKIKRFRKQSDMDQKTLAQKLNVSPKTVSSWEVNRTQPKMDMIDAMCRVFNCKRSDFLDEDVDDESFWINLDPSDPAARLQLYSRLMTAAANCSTEELSAVLTILERHKKKKKKKED